MSEFDAAFASQMALFRLNLARRSANDLWLYLFNTRQIGPGSIFKADPTAPSEAGQ